ncbi:hypothetical protein BK022_00230 [Methylorubrum extorquens]|uniref:Uncharacterized protein n=1 Tax=Methylorubrum extorquens TaxID=408 RepID=A0A1S1P9H3_METEX|nr:hypothetical protein BK022_00230 [Methylorubrum extorquens]
MTDNHLNLNHLNQAQRADLSRATYFMLESYYETDDHNMLDWLEEAPQFAIHIGLPDCPARRYALNFDSFDSALQVLGELKRSHPDAGMWLSCQEILAEIEGDDVWRGAINARASYDPTNDECGWTRLAAAIAEFDLNGQPVSLHDDDPDVFEDIVERINAASCPKMD